jgi:hypothetical protein
LQSAYNDPPEPLPQAHWSRLGGRYKAQLLEGSGDGYLLAPCAYVDLNPGRVRLLKPDERAHQS